MRVSIRWQTPVQFTLASIFAFLVGALYGSYAAVGMVMIVVFVLALAYGITWLIGLGLRANGAVPTEEVEA